MTVRAGAIRAQGVAVPVCLAALFAAGPAAAVNIDTGNPDVRLDWDTTVRLSAAWRLQDPDTAVAGDISTAQVNTNDGDLNFDKGLVSERVDLLSAINLNYKRIYGLRVSGQGWYDEVYQRGTDNPGGQGINASDTPADEFVKAARDLQGQHAELMDAFAYGTFTPGGKRVNVKLGRFTQLYGESLFFGTNGVAAAQASLDLAKALSVPNPQFKEVARPVAQASVQA